MKVQEGKDFEQLKADLLQAIYERAVVLEVMWRHGSCHGDDEAEKKYGHIFRFVEAVQKDAVRAIFDAIDNDSDDKKLFADFDSISKKVDLIQKYSKVVKSEEPKESEGFPI